MDLVLWFDMYFFAKTDKLPEDWQTLERSEQVDELIERSKVRPVVVFKHSTRCSISGYALRRLSEDWKEVSNKVTLYYLDLLAHRNISDDLASILGVAHQSPQIIILKDGLPVLDCSHEQVDIKPILEALNAG